MSLDRIKKRVVCVRVCVCEALVETLFLETREPRYKIQRDEQNKSTRRKGEYKIQRIEICVYYPPVVRCESLDTETD